MRGLAILGVASAPIFLIGCGSSNESTTTLTEVLQAVLDTYSAKHSTVAVSLGFKNADQQIGLASGQFWRPGTSGYQATKSSDKFLYGSGTKPFTAAAVMSLVESGKVSLEDNLEKHIDPFLDSMKKGTSMESLFGSNGTKVTVGQVLQMKSGLNDFDWPKFDQSLLVPPASYALHSPLEILEYVATQLKPGLCPVGYTCEPFLCEPGSCVAYSSTNYVLAGLVLVAHMNATSEVSGDWYNLNMWEFYRKSLKVDMPNSQFFNNEMIDEVATVPGFAAGGWGGYPNTTIWNQSSSILGWTCGNLAATAEDNAVFFWNLLGSESKILNETTVQGMKDAVTPLTTGWAANDRSYGTGLMMVQVGKGKKYGVPPKWGEWGTYLGHGGDTYGFLSEQGFVWGINASLTVVVNHDSPGIGDLYCSLIEAAAQVLVPGVETGLQCKVSDAIVQVAHIIA